jgi:hypothetical protein
MVLLAVVVVASLVGAVEPWSLPTAAHPLRGHVGSRTCRTALAVRVQPPAVSVRGRTAGCLGMTEAGHTHDESCGPACSQEPGAVLMEKLGAIDSSDDRRAMLRGNFQQCDGVPYIYIYIYTYICIYIYYYIYIEFRRLA